MRWLRIIFWIGLISSTACNKSINEAEVKQVRGTFDSLYQIGDSLKRLAFASENIKLETTRLLLKEIEFIGSYDVSLYQELETNLDSMQQSLYDEQSMTDENYVTQYDDYTLKMIESLRKLVASVREFKGQKRAAALFEEVIQADNDDFNLRKNYNLHASSINAFLKKQQQNLSEIVGDKDSLKKWSYYYGTSLGDEE